MYRKYYYDLLIVILRVRCQGCRKTHALIPAFSLPGTSIGCAELERFIEARAQGSSRRIAASVFEHRGLGESYPRWLERRVVQRIHQAKALFPERGDHAGCLWRWVIDAAGVPTRAAFALNRLSIAAGWGAVFCALAPGVGRRGHRAGIAGSHNRGSAPEPPVRIDSG